MRRIVPCPLCGFVALVVTTIRGLFGGHRHLSWSRVVCLRGHRSVTASGEARQGGGLMHAARLNRSERLRRVHGLLSDGLEHSTLEIALEARVCAVNSIAAELRANGFLIECRQACGPHGGRIWLYRMTAPAGEAA